MARAWAMTCQLRVRLVNRPPAGERITSAPRSATMRATSGVHSSEQTTRPISMPSTTTLAKTSPGETSSPSPSSEAGMVAGWVRA